MTKRRRKKKYKRQEQDIPKKRRATEIFLKMEGHPSTHVHEKELLHITYVSFWRLHKYKSMCQCH